LRDNRGFSLMELILVLFIVGLAASLATPYVSSSLDRIKNQTTVRKIASSLRYARTQAIAQKTLVVFNASIDNKQYWIAEAKTNEPIGNTITLGPEIRMAQFSDQNATLTQGAFSIVFYPQGNSSGGSFKLETMVSGKPGSLYSIAIDQVTGKPYVEETTQ
jgi:type II secretion system protein H